MTGASFTIDGRRVGATEPYVVAEIGINHDGDPAKAAALVRAAHESGAHAAKLQAFVPEKLLTRSSRYFDLLASVALDAATIRSLFALARELGFTLFSAAFDEASADVLAEAGAPAFKIASGDITHLPLLRHVARFGRPMLISTGGATMDEVRVALNAVHDAAPDLPVALFHCVSNYPTRPEDANLACMATMRTKLGVPVGFSDHTLGLSTPIAAAALGAELIEKHFTLDRAAAGPDHALSVEPVELAALVEGVSMAHRSVGRAEKAPVEPPDFIPQIRRSPSAAVDIPAGTEITRAMIEMTRPGTGIAPAALHRIVGRRAARDIARDTTLSWDMIAGGRDG